MKSQTLILTFILLLSVSAQSIDYLYAVEQYFQGIGNATNTDTSGLSSCFDDQTAQLYLESIELTFDLVFEFANSNYPYLEMVSQYLNYVTAGLNSTYACISNTFNGESLNLAIWGTNNIPIINAMSQAFIFDHTQDYLDLQTNVLDQMTANNFAFAGALAAELGMTARILVNEVGISREIFNMVQTGSLFYFNLTVPSQSLLCASEAAAQLALDNMGEFVYIVATSDAQSLISNIESFEQQNVGLLDILYPMSQCISSLPEAAQYQEALGYNTETSEWGYAVWSYIEYEPDFVIDLFTYMEEMLAMQSYIGAGIVMSEFNQIVADFWTQSNSTKN